MKVFGLYIIWVCKINEYSILGVQPEAAIESAPTAAGDVDVAAAVDNAIEADDTGI
jgi:hypothetical protein